MTTLCAEAAGGRGEYVVHGHGDIVLQFQRLAFRTFDMNRTHATLSSEYNIKLGVAVECDMFGIFLQQLILLNLSLSVRTRQRYDTRCYFNVRLVSLIYHTEPGT